MQHQCPLGLGSVLVIFVSLQAYDPGICIDKILTQVQCRNLSTGGAGSLGLSSNTSRCIFAFLVASRRAALHSVFGPKKGLNEFVQCFDMDYVYKVTLDLGRGKVAQLLRKVLCSKTVFGNLGACSLCCHVPVLQLGDLLKSLTLEPAVGKSVVASLAISVLVD